MRPDVAILGGGVIGLTTAYTLAKDGATVVVVDQGPMGAEASWAGAGILPPGNLAEAVSPFDRLRSLSASLFPGLSESLRSETGLDNGFRVCGAVAFADPDDTGMSPEEWRGAGVRATMLGPGQYASVEPALAGGLGEATWLPDLAQVRNPRHLQALAAACDRLRTANGGPRVELLAGVAAYALLREGSRIDAVHTSQGLLEADRYLIATGAWTAGLMRPLGWSLPIEPVRGQIALLNPGPPLLKGVVAYGSRYLVPRAEGRVLVGSTEEYVGFDRRTSASGVQGLLELATRLVPDLGRATLEKTWAGLRPGNRDGLPYLGQWPELDNLYLAAGHFRAGLQLSAGTARVMADLLTGKTPTLDLEPFAPMRHTR